MPQTRTTCPRCRQPVMVDVTQLFDVNADPQAKQRILSGNFNIIHCPSCGYEGSLATPLVYHDAEKELLLTYFPPELGMPINEQERLIGPLINQVVNKLPPEKRKGYLFRPQNMLTMQTMVERILEGDGITREMIQAQQQRLNLIQRLMTVKDDELPEIAKQEDALLDESFFALLSRLIEASAAGGDENSANQLAALQQKLLPLTNTGKRLQEQVTETQEAVKSLQEASKKGLTREKLLDLIIKAPNETRLNALVGMARGGMDYSFFDLLSQRIDKAKDEEKTRLLALRERLLHLTHEIDQEVQNQVSQAHQLLEEILKAENVEEATLQKIPEINDLFLEIIKSDLEETRKKGDLERLKKLQQVMSTLQKASAPPPEYALIEELISAPDDEQRQKILENRPDQVTPEFMDMLNNLVAQTQNQARDADQELNGQLEAAYRSALRFSMQANMKK
ncbi:MAG: CpXC domain-containing protein [Chloroflexi bacterium]|nr:CpXC domain-containing protein [Chloroflexota bacterium]